ncbi:zinc-binding alcohol dehydrogenase family protein [Enterococcus faecalis]
MIASKTMPAIGFYEGLPLEKEASFINQQIQVPEPGTRDLLVAVRAVSVNPVDTKLRLTTPKQQALRILGFDAVGEVVAVGSAVRQFAVGDRVFYAGTSKRAGSNQALQLVDERIVALAPQTLSDESAAALPLTALTAYELLFEKFGLVAAENRNCGQKILVINGAGGVGSILTQLAHWSGLDVIATASPQNFSWLIQNGVDHPIDYHQLLKKSLTELSLSTVDYLAALYDITPYFHQIQGLIRPFGHVGTIVATTQPLDLAVWKNASISFDWEYMFAKTDYHYQIETQGQALKKIAQLVDEGKLTSTATKFYRQGINAAVLKQATAEVEAGHMRGKVVISGPFNGLDH